MEKIGKYKILGKLGQGGMGVVYKALDPLLERTVALKTIAGSLDSEPDLRARFFREGRSAASLSHRNIITVYDLGEEDGMAYMAMEFLDGEDLRRKISERKLRSLEERLVIMIELCEGLAHAHSRNVIHRDIKPANVFITRSGQVKILDFGLARMTSSDLTRTGVAMGSPNYMSPEQVRGESVDQRADVFSAGALFYELLTLHKPFDANSVPATIVKILQGEPEPVEKFEPSIHPRLVEIVRRALEKDLTQRYPDVESLLDDLKEYCSELPGMAWVKGRSAKPLVDPVPAAGEPTMRDLSSLGATLLEGQEGLQPSLKRRSGPSLPGEPARGRFRPLHYAVAACVLLALGAPAVYFGMRDRAGRSSADAAENSRATSDHPVTKGADPAPGPSSAEGEAREPVRDDREPRPGAPEQPRSGATTPSEKPRADPAAGRAALTPAVKAGMVAQGNERARSLIREGKYEEATARLGEVLGVSPQDADALRLAAQLNSYAEKSATDALSQMTQSRLKAEGAGASRYAPKSFEAAQGMEQEGRRLRDERRYGEAAARLLNASGLYLSAALESEAGKAEEEKRARLQEQERTLSLQRQQADASRVSFEQERLNAAKADAETKAAQRYQEAANLGSEAQAKWETGDFTGAKAGFERAASAMRQARSAAQEVSRNSAGPAVDTVGVNPAPSSPVPASGEAARGAISSVLQQYVSSLNSRDIQKLREIWPGLGGQQEKALQEQFSAARQIDVQLGDVELKVAGETATATARRSLSMLTVDGQKLQSEIRAVVYLKRGAKSWLIDRIRFEPLR